MSDCAGSLASKPRGAGGTGTLKARIARLILDRFTTGSLSLQLPSGETYFRRATAGGPDAVLAMHSWRLVRRLITRGDIGFAEGYMEGDWSSPDLVALLSWGIHNEASLTPAWQGTFFNRLADRLRHVRRANTRRGSRRNIAAHYDLGNDFYAAWLDPTLSYSSALYGEERGETLEQAQRRKISHALEMLDIEPGQRMLEIGCGWGALAAQAITQHAAVYTGLTLSREQLAVAQVRVADADKTGASAALLQDYRDVDGSFDRIVSIEMFEAAGEAYWPAYFAKLHDCLRPGGVAVVQTISICDERFDAYRRRPDFIQTYIFPGGMLPTVGRMRALAADAGLLVEGIELFGQSYARTLKEWRTRFNAQWPHMTGKVATARFRNMWDYYLAYCEAGFAHGATDVGLYRFRRPKA